MEANGNYGSADYKVDGCGSDDVVQTLSYAKHEFEASKAAPFGRRFGAALIDGLLIGLNWSILFVVAGLMYHSLVLSKTPGYVPSTRIDLPNSWALSCIGVHGLCVWMYFALMESSKYQASLGKLLFRIHVTDMNNKRLRILHSLCRAIIKFLWIPLAFLALLIQGEAGFVFVIISMMWPLTYLLTFFEIHGQAFHDKLALTLVRCGQPVQKEDTGYAT